jgi:hypothetical protein
MQGELTGLDALFHSNQLGILHRDLCLVVNIVMRPFLRAVGRSWASPAGGVLSICM